MQSLLSVISLNVVQQHYLNGYIINESQHWTLMPKTRNVKHNYRLESVWCVALSIIQLIV